MTSSNVMVSSSSRSSSSNHDPPRQHHPEDMFAYAGDDLWRDVIGGGGGDEAASMTLEAFLARAGAVKEEGIRVPGGARWKRKAAVEEAAMMDKATQQKQRRMIKNRESAARSRERKQAYTVALESSVTQLEEDHAKLLREEAKLNRARYEQLMETLVPVTEKPRPRRSLRRVNSMEW